MVMHVPLQLIAQASHEPLTAIDVICCYGICINNLLILSISFDMNIDGTL